MYNSVEIDNKNHSYNTCVYITFNFAAARFKINCYFSFLFTFRSHIAVTRLSDMRFLLLYNMYEGSAKSSRPVKTHNVQEDSFLFFLNRKSSINHGWIQQLPSSLLKTMAESPPKWNPASFFNFFNWRQSFYKYCESLRDLIHFSRNTTTCPFYFYWIVTNKLLDAPV